MSQVLYAVDRISWLYENRQMIGGLNFVEEPATLRFFFGRLEPIGDWQEQLVAKFRKDLGEFVRDSRPQASKALPSGRAFYMQIKKLPPIGGAFCLI
ncbi:MAG: hypothetical protein R2912_04575 [Eubacteriales bacterium]